MPTVKDINISANEITEYNIAPSSVTNTRNDQASIVKLNNGTLVCGYSRFGDTPTDIGQSQVYISKSTDNGVTWSVGEPFIPQISEGSYIASFYKRLDGNILVVYFVREAGTTQSTIRAVVYDSTLTNIITPSYTILSGEYMPIASDRLFFDKKNNKLLFPYPVLISGTGTSYLSVYHTKMIYSDNDGDTWQDSGILIEGKLDVRGYGGAVEPGLFQNFDKLILYARNTVGTIYGNDLTWNGTNYVASAMYSLGLLAQNAMSSIKFDEESNLFIASYTKLNDKPVGDRRELAISTSKDAKSWNEVFILSKNTAPYLVNEPNIFIDDENVIVTYSRQPNANRWDLMCKRYKKSFFAGSEKQFRSFATNPTLERNEIAISEYDVSEYERNAFGNVVRTTLNVHGEIAPTGINAQSFYNLISYIRINGMTPDASIALQKVVSSSSQAYFKDVQVENFFSNYTSVTRDSFVNSFVGKYALLGATLIAEDNKVGDLFGLYLEGARSRNYLEGSLSIGKEKVDAGVKLDVVGKIQATGGDSEKWNEAFSWGDWQLFGLKKSKYIVDADLSAIDSRTAFFLAANTTNSPIAGRSYIGIVMANPDVTSRSAKIMIDFSAINGGFYHQRGISEPFRRHWTDGDFDIKDYVKVGYTAPASPTATGVRGEIRMTADYTYTCIATNTWKRTATDATWV